MASVANSLPKPDIYAGFMGGALNIDDARPAGFEPATYSLEGCCSIQLSYGREERQNSNSAGEPANHRVIVQERRMATSFRRSQYARYHEVSPAGRDP